MPPKLLFDISGIDLNKVLYGQDVIRECNPQRGDMEQLNGVVYADPEKQRLIAFKDVRADEFWVSGHIPGRPLLPGVLMIEAGAQAASFYMRKCMGWEGFVGFGAVVDCKFRAAVTPGCRLYILAQKTWDRHQRFSCEIQGLVNGNLVFETSLVGTKM